ncbi:ABC transporter ATP-binding protein [Georgenia ruanii]|nr:ATP-binding cassette domain-containing protein [Georgenia ruanii]
MSEQAAMTDTLAATGITRSFRGVKALSGVDLAVTRGAVLGLIGPNGAGKSTLVNIISGYDRPDTGTVTMDGTDVTRTDARTKARSGLARTFQHGHTYHGLSVRENIEVAALGTGRRRAEARRRAEELMERLGIADRANQMAATLPHGTERRLGVARALAVEPRYLLLDEPAAGLNEGEIGEFGEVVRSIAAAGTGVLLIDHNIRLIMAVCDLIHVVVQGKSFLEGTPAEVQGSEALAEAYLGRSGRVHDAA